MVIDASQFELLLKVLFQAYIDSPFVSIDLPGVPEVYQSKLKQFRHWRIQNIT